MEPWRYSGPDFWRMTFIKLPGRLYSGAASGCCWPTWTTLWPPTGRPCPDERLKAWRDELAEHGVTLFILSNNRHESRPRIFAEALDVPYIGHAGKPKTASFFKAMERMKAAPEQTAIVGDQIFTDILGGSRAGWPPFWCADPAGRQSGAVPAVCRGGALPAAVPRGRRIVSGIRTAREAPAGRGAKSL